MKGSNDPNNLNPNAMKIPKTPNTTTKPIVSVNPMNKPFSKINRGDSEEEDLLKLNPT
jgi:hypothetical protein